MKLKNFAQTDEFVNECIIGATKLKDSIVLVKNRDRNYVPLIEIVHETYEGVEMIYLRDKYTDWMEGINEFGVCIVNSALAVEYDEAEFEEKMSADTPPNPAYSGIKIREALRKKTARGAVNSILKQNYKDLIEERHKRHRIMGHTLVADEKDVYHIESDGHRVSRVKYNIDDESITFTNHGHQLAELGYPDGFNRKSSESRQRLSKDVLESQNKSRELLLQELRTQFLKNTKLNPFRQKPQKGKRLFTTAQILFDTKNRTMYFAYNDDICKFDGVRTNIDDKHKSTLQLKLIKIE